MIRKIIGWIFIIYAIVPNVLILKVNEANMMAKWNVSNYMLYNVIVNVISIVIFLLGCLLIMSTRNKKRRR